MRVDVDHPLFHAYRCWVDGVEVSRDCFRADDEVGYADLYVRDDEGAIQLAERPRTWPGQWGVSKVIRWTRLYGEVRLEVDDD